MHGYRKTDLVILVHCWRLPGIAAHTSKVKCLYVYFVSTVIRYTKMLELQTWMPTLQYIEKQRYVYLSLNSNVQIDMAAKSVAN